MRVAGYAIAAALLACCGLARADEGGCDVHDKREPTLCAYEPNSIGYTQDSDDVGFMDFKISIRYQLFPDSITRGLNHIDDGLGLKYSLYMAFTGRFGQYIGTRESSPVIGKRFNPKLFLRRWGDAPDRASDSRGYIDFAYGHESNGQSINTAAQYAAAQAALVAAGERADFANDHLSRGWDYLELVWKKAEYSQLHGLSSYVTLKYFLDNGLLQGKPEEYYAFENNPEGKPRNQVNGVAGMLKYVVVTEQKWAFKDLKLVGAYETGYREIFRYNTFRFEIGSKLSQLPLNFWYQNGYNSDLAMYYKKVISRGIEIQIGSF